LALTHTHTPTYTQGEVRLRELLFRGDVDTDIAQLAKIFQILGMLTAVRRWGRDKGKERVKGMCS
jgi:hypothetical protein